MLVVSSQTVKSSSLWVGVKDQKKNIWNHQDFSYNDPQTPYKKLDMILVNQSYKTSQSTGIQSEFKAILGGGNFPFLPHHHLGKTLSGFAFKARLAQQQLPRWSHWAAPPIPWKRGRKFPTLDPRDESCHPCWKISPNWYPLEYRCFWNQLVFWFSRQCRLLLIFLSWNIWIEI